MTPSIPMSNCEPYIQMYGGIEQLVESLQVGSFSNEYFIKRVAQLLSETRDEINKRREAAIGR